MNIVAVLTLIWCSGTLVLLSISGLSEYEQDSPCDVHGDQ